MAKDFYSVPVKEIYRSTNDCVIVSFDIPNELEQTFSFKQGQYINLKATVKGEEVIRSYSLCSSPLDKQWSVGIKKIEGGRFSTYANDILKVGDQLEIMPPDGSFYIDVDPNKKRNYVAFGAGSGITPIVSIIKTHLEKEPHSTFKLFYVNKNSSSIILKEELESLKNIYMDRFEIFYFLTREHRNVKLFNGRIDEEKLDIIFKSICDVNNVDHYFSCGPEAMILLVENFLLEKGVPKTNIHFELFGTVDRTEEKKQIAKDLQGKQSTITILEGGKSLDFVMETGSNNLLDQAMFSAADLPYACKGGVCCTCKAKLLEGEVNMLVNYGLEEDEVADGYILTCQAIPVSEKVVVDFDG